MHIISFCTLRIKATALIHFTSFISGDRKTAKNNVSENNNETLLQKWTFENL